MLQHLIIKFQLCQVVADGKLKTNEFQTFSSESGHGRLREVVAHKRFQIQP